MNINNYVTNLKAKPLKVIKAKTIEDIIKESILDPATKPLSIEKLTIAQIASIPELNNVGSAVPQKSINVPQLLICEYKETEKMITGSININSKYFIDRGCKKIEYNNYNLTENVLIDLEDSNLDEGIAYYPQHNTLELYGGQDTDCVFIAEEFKTKKELNQFKKLLKSLIDGCNAKYPVKDESRPLINIAPTIDVAILEKQFRDGKYWIRFRISYKCNDIKLLPNKDEGYKREISHNISCTFGYNNNDCGDGIIRYNYSDAKLHIYLPQNNREFGRLESFDYREDALEFERLLVELQKQF